MDTNACVTYLRAGDASPMTSRLAAKRSVDVYLCSIVKAELIFGARKSREANANLVMVREFMAPFSSLPFDDIAAEAYGQIRASLAEQGVMIGPNDLLIASIAKVHDLTLVTHNVGEFSRVPGLKIEDWEL